MAAGMWSPSVIHLYQGNVLMSQQVGRNDLCPCGSGVKMKNCHPKGYGVPSKNRNVWIIGGGIVALVIVAVIMMGGKSPAPPQRVPASPATNNAASGGGGTPQPGPAPEGKVWSSEHGHWHDAQGAQATTNPIVQPAGQPAGQTAKPLTPQPDGPVPEGKVWSAEHGHWHNDPAAATPSPNPAPAQPEEAGP